MEKNIMKMEEQEKDSKTDKPGINHSTFYLELKEDWFNIDKNIMTENKYYVPQIEEFHIGFEYELLKKKSVYDKEWRFDIIKRIFDIKTVSNSHDWARFNIDLEDKEIRVKYLDQSDIESLGWRFGEICFNDYKLFFVIDKEDKSENIAIYQESLKRMLFTGNIKNKSELKKLHKQLGII